MATTQINQKIHDIAEARWKMLPIAVQREHDTLAMDISELQVKFQSFRLNRPAGTVILARSQRSQNAGADSV